MKRTCDRQLWLTELLKIVHPVLINLAEDKLTANMPYLQQLDFQRKRSDFRNLEAFGRVFNGLAPWLSVELRKQDDEFDLQKKYKTLVLNSFSTILNPNTKDYVDFGCGSQCMVDAAYLCQGILRFKAIWNEFSVETKNNLIFELKKTRKYEVADNNWLLFASMIEATLLTLTKQCNLNRLKKGVYRFMNKFYLGDSIYSDGADFTFNYYNSFVIHPMLTDVLKVAEEQNLKIKKYYLIQVSRQKRYSEILERLISPEGTYPILGRTITCRLGVFHSLSHSVLQNNLSSKLTYGQVRSALTVVLKKQFKGEVSNYDEDDWLKIGFIGEQLSLAEEYINTGSPYHTTCFFLPLGLSKKHIFWQQESQKWSSLKIWDGEDCQKDVAIQDKKKQFYFVAKIIKKIIKKLKRIFK